MHLDLLRRALEMLKANQHASDDECPECEADVFSTPPHRRTCPLAALLRDLEAAVATGGWRSGEPALPSYYACTDGRRVWGDLWTGDGWYGDGPVTAWQPLPAPPGAVNDNGPAHQ